MMQINLRKYTEQKAIRRMVCTVLLIAIVTFINTANTWGQDKIRIGMGAFSPTNSAIWFAEEQGFFKKHGLEVEAIAYFKGNKESVQVIFKKMRMSPEQAKYAERTWDQYADTYFERVPYPSPSGIRTVLDGLVKENPKAKTADPNSFVDASILKSIEDSGIIKSLYD